MIDKLPPLSIDAFGKVNAIELFADSLLLTCIGHGGVDTAKAIRGLRICVNEMFVVYLEFYSSFGHPIPNVLQKIEAEIAETIAVMFKLVLPSGLAEQEARDVITQKLKIYRDTQSQPPPRNPKPKRAFDPNPQLLEKTETLNRAQTARALGVSTRTLDRYVKDRKLTPMGGGGRKRFKTSDVRKFINQKSKDI
jgi:helix-turn-helix protein